MNIILGVVLSIATSSSSARIQTINVDLDEDQSYELRANSWCSPYRENFETLSEAKRQCTNDPLCATVYDDGGSHNHFLLCDAGAKFQTSSAGSLLYIKIRTNTTIKETTIATVPKRLTELPTTIVGCLCKDFVNNGGHGNCKTASQSNSHHGRKMCYVIQPSSCGDLVNSGANRGEKFSEEACDIKDEGSNIQTSSAGSLLHIKRRTTTAIKENKIATVPKRLTELPTTIAGCLCKGFINKSGHGNCKTTSQSNSHHGRKMCYVIQPSSCGDLVNSGANRGEKFSEEACDIKNEGTNIQTSSAGSLLHIRRRSTTTIKETTVASVLERLKKLPTTIAGCLCKDFVNKGGHGNCKTTSQSNLHHGRKMCYVIQPSSCGDLVNSGANRGEKFSEEACDIKDEDANIQTSSAGSLLHIKLQPTQNIQSTQNNIPGRQSSHCRDQKIWCNIADCSLENVKRNCQETCNLC